MGVSAYVLNESSEYSTFLEFLGMMLEGCPAQHYTAIEDVGNNSDLGACDWEEWPAQSKPEGRFVVGLVNHSLSITNTMLGQKGFPKCTWHKKALGQR